MTNALNGSFYRAAYICPIYDRYNELPAEITGYMIRGLVTPTGNFLPPHALPIRQRRKYDSFGFGSWWFKTEADAQQAVDQVMSDNGVSDL